MPLNHDYIRYTIPIEIDSLLTKNNSVYLLVSILTPTPYSLRNYIGRELNSEIILFLVLCTIVIVGYVVYQFYADKGMGAYMNEMLIRIPLVFSAEYEPEP